MARFTLSSSAKVASDGTATATVTMTGAGTFEVRRITVNVSTASTTSSVAKLYRERVSDANYLQGSVTGDGDTDTQPELDLDPGETLACYWTGAAAGATAFIRLEGRLADS